MEGAAPTGSRHMDIALLTALGVVIALSIGQFAYEFSHQQTVPRSAASATAPFSTPKTVSAAEASIAVLPFVNMSGDPSKEYFSDGVSEELLNDLANNPGLRVAARTSAFAFKGKNEDIQKIALTLHVRAILEGSVREIGDHLRITAQLINAADGYHLWSATYDRDLTDILVVQDDIARAITTALAQKLLVRATGPCRPNQRQSTPKPIESISKANIIIMGLSPTTLWRRRSICSNR